MGTSLTKPAKERLGTVRRNRTTEISVKDCQLPKVSVRICRLAYLKKIDASKNNISRIPSDIKKLINLEELNLGFNSLTKLRSEFKYLINLVWLSLEANHLTELPSDVDTLTKLRYLNIGGNNLTELNRDFVEAFAPVLEELRYASSQLKDVPRQVYTLKNLRVLDLSHNLFVSFPDELSTMTNLETLIINRNKITALSPFIGNLKSLKVLDVSNNELSALPDELFSLDQLTELRFDENRVVTISPHLGKLTSLVELSFPRNHVTAIPGTIGRCRKLKTLNFAGNQVTVLPHQVGYLYETLRKLQISNNPITTLPGELSYLNPAITFEFNNVKFKSPFNAWCLENMNDFLPKLTPYMHADSTKSFAEGSNMLNAQASTGSFFTVKAFDFRGNARISGGDTFVCKCTGTNVDFAEDFIVKDEKNGTYTVYFNLHQPGTYRIDVSAYDEPIQNSPFMLTIQ